MIKDYKGEMPNNVVTPEKAKAQKPFYKNWKFWVLTGLMTLFGACSIYGLVLGSQYVKAIERASHIIADAQETKSEGVSKNKVFAPLTSSNNEFDFSFSVTLPEEHVNYFVDLRTGDSYSSNDLLPSPTLCLRMVWAEPYWFFGMNQKTDSLGFVVLTNFDHNNDSVANDNVWVHLTTFNVSNNAFLSGASAYYVIGSSFSVSGHAVISTDFKSGYQEGYSNGDADGYQNGYEEGYSEGYSDGSDAINVNQAFRVVMPVGNDSVQYQSYIDGVADQQGQVVGGSTSPNYREFTRNRNQVLRVDLTLPSGYRAFWSYTPAFTSSFPVSDNLSLQESWAVDGVVYLPTWVSSVQIWVGVTSAQVPDLTTQSISVAFDVAHWGDIKVGAYYQGYQQGYVDGQQDPTAYQSGYDAGYEDGHDAGEVAGYNRGVADGTSGSQSLAHMFRVAFQLPFDQLYAYLNFNLLGINFASLFTALITVSLGIIVIKKVL